MSRKTQPVVADQVGRIDQYNDLRKEASQSSFLMAYADGTTTTLKVLINEGSAYFGGTLVEFAGGYSPEITDTTASSRIDVLSFKSDNSITRTAGVEADSPTTPAIPAGEIPICAVYMRKSATKITDTSDGTNGYIYKDLRATLLTTGQLAPGAEIFGRAATERTITGTGAYTKVKEILVGKGGRITVSFDLKRVGNIAYGKVYINGIAVGTERTDNTASYVTFTEDFNVSIGDLVQLYYHDTASGGASIRNLMILTQTSYLADKILD